MLLSLVKSVTAMGVNTKTYVAGSGGTAPYVYSIATGGAGGTINASTGLYTAPAEAPEDPRLSQVTLVVTDADDATAEAEILITTALGLFCEVIQREMGLADGRVYLWDQKINTPTDNGLFVAVSVPICKPFANTNQYDGSGSGLDSIQSLNMYAICDLDIISRGPAARDRKELVIMALKSTYSEAQQERNSFYIGKLPAGAQFVNLSQIDGAAIPYRYRISIALQYFVKKTQAVEYFTEFDEVSVTTDP